ncbi:MAG TPA: M48 family metalloprotease [Terriglobales bacterium]|nr:M48 family metalloprotease [Terriglobales bacterium]
MKVRHRIQRWFLVCLAFASLASFASAQQMLPSPSGFNLFSQQQDIQLGEQNAAQVSKQMPVLPDSSPVTQYVRRLGQKLIAVMPQPTYPYNFHVVQEKDINAFALPGGPIYVNLGTITAADNEAGLAGVMAHEMSHVYMRHSTKMASRQMAAQLPLALLGGMLGNSGSLLARAAELGIAFGVNSYFLKYSRTDEAQADAVGAEIMYNAGYNPVAMADFFRKLEAEGGARGPQFLSDHPNPGNRVAAVSREIAAFPPRQFQQDSPQFQSARLDAGKIRAYTAQQIQSGAWRGQTPQAGSGGMMAGLAAPGAAPSGTFRQFDHQDYQISYPDNWQVRGDQTSAATIAPGAGVTRGAVAYGVIVSGYQPENSGSLDQGTHQLLTSLRASNPNLRQIGNDQDIRVNGIAGKSVDLIGVSPIQQGGRALPERDWLVTLQRGDGSLMYLVFLAPEGDFSRLRPTFEQMLKTLRLK